MKGKKLCLYCQTINPSDEISCIACGALLTSKSQTDAIVIEKKNIPVVKINNNPEKAFLETAKKVGKEADHFSLQAWGFYGLLWRTVAEAVTIAVVSFGLGVIGGATSLPFWGIVLGISFGVLVGFVFKSYLWLLVGTPIGFVIGAVIGILLSLFGFGPKIILIIVFVFSSLSVYIGGQFKNSKQKNRYEKFRPYLGGAGGLVFSLIGMGIGLGLSALVNQLY